MIFDIDRVAVCLERAELPPIDSVCYDQPHLGPPRSRLSAAVEKLENHYNIAPQYELTAFRRVYVGKRLDIIERHQNFDRVMAIPA